MKVIKTKITGLVIIEPDVFQDERGYFFESWNQKKFNESVTQVNFVQDNQSCSLKGALRGLHFQNPPHDQGKLVRVISGSILDVAVDIRKKSSTYGQYVSVELTAENKNMFYIPAGFAHGFLALEDNTIMSYKCTNDYNKESEGSLLWNDKNININWGIENPIISKKDLNADSFTTFNSLFND